MQFRRRRRDDLEIREHPTGSQPARDLAEELALARVVEVMNGETGNDEVELAERTEVVAQIVLQHPHPFVVAKPLARPGEHRRRRVEGDDFGHRRSRLEHERREPAVTAPEIGDSIDAHRQHLGQHRLSREPGASPPTRRRYSCAFPASPQPAPPVPPVVSASIARVLSNLRSGDHPRGDPGATFRLRYCRAVSASDDEALVEFASAKAWAAWLAENHSTSTGVWLKLAKKASGDVTVSYSDALDVALCYGWIDGRKAKLDERAWRQRFSPRTAQSKWSKLNRARVERLVETGAMKPPGLAEVQRAQADGRWKAAYDAASTATVPADLRRELKKHPEAAAFFATLDSRNRYAILYRIQDAKKPETRARRIEKFVAMLEAHEKIHP